MPGCSEGADIKVVFHADDFGLTKAVNAGILEANARGLLRSTSLIACGTDAKDAAEGASAQPGLDVGLHITLVEERPVLPPERIPSLVTAGRFWGGFGAVWRRYLLGRWRPAEARAEIAAQWDRLVSLGIRPSHCDGHQHLHLLPRLFPWVVAQARERGVRFVRTRLAEPLAQSGSVVRGVQLLGVRGVARLATWYVPAADRAATVPFVTVGFGSAGGVLTAARLLAILDRLTNEPIVEVMLHPGHSDRETRQRYGHWGYRWERDLELLLDPALAEALHRRGIEVTSFRELAGALPAAPAVDAGPRAGKTV